MFRKTIVSLLLVISFITLVPAQATDADKKEKDTKLKEDAVSLLRETSSEVMNLRTAENRIGFSSEIASLMWFYDEKEARQMFNSVTNDFRQMLQQFDAQANAMKAEEETSEMYGETFFGSPNKQVMLYRKFSRTLSVRQQIATALSEHDAVLAYSFYTETASVITNPNFKAQIDQSNSYFESRLVQAIAEQDAAKGLEFGRKSLAKGVNTNHIELLQKIYAKDADAGAAFGDEIVGKLKSPDGETWEKRYLYGRILALGLENRKAIKEKPTQKPIFSEQNLRDVAELAAQDFLDNESGNSIPDSGIVDYIEQITPARAAPLRQKIKASSMSSNSYSMNSNSVVPMRVEERPRKPSPEKQTFEALKNLEKNKLSDADRAKAIADAGKIIEKITDPKAKMMALSALATQMAKAGDKETALQIMKQAESFVPQSPRNFMDYMQLWMLASGYSQVEPERAFPVLETAVAGLNDTIAAFIKVGEFIDVSGEIMEDGEVQVSGFGGGGITREISGALSASDSTLENLAMADFTRTRNLANKFDRAEVRILAKMLILRSVLRDKTKPQTEVGMIEN